jgi:NADH:ubiquinone oxidoreductase subunit F (NADH-binding)/NADH:ubiquinone oxidoreductase subunit E
VNLGSGRDSESNVPEAAAATPALLTSRTSAAIFDELRQVQDQYGYLPTEQLKEVAAKLGKSVSQVHASASFYPHFHTKEQAKVQVRVCCDMSCHTRGGGPLLTDLRQRFSALPDEISVQEVSCLGQCDGAPALSVNDHIYRNIAATEAEGVIWAARAGRPLPETPSSDGPVQLASDPYKNSPRYGAVRAYLKNPNWDGVLAALAASGLSGMGGAAFPTHIKWKAVRDQKATPKYVVCNADESEPGTIKDRYILTHLPHLVIEGMILAGLVTGAKEGVLYIRHEYGAQEHILKEEILRCYEEGLLGHNLLGSGLTFDLELFVSPGGYICGEESALIEAIEGKRAEPRNKPPFPVEQGLWHLPTALNNVETFAHVPQILINGVDWYKAQGQGGAAGLKFVGLSGDIQNPGIYEIPMGLPMSEAIKLAGGVLDGKKLKGYAPSGPSSGYLPASMDNIRLDFKSMAAAGSMLGSGAIVICAEGRCMLDMALNSIKFFRRESCGKCVPCRVGSRKMEDMLTGWTQGKGNKSDLDLLHELTEALKLTSICGLGQFAHSPITSVLQHFPDEVNEHVLHKRCPENVCPMR